MMLSNLWVYAHCLYVQPDRGTCYPQLFFGFMDKPSAIVENIGWWFKSTDQGMWPMTLQNAEETTCLGWLLYSANEFDRETLCQEIWQLPVWLYPSGSVKSMMETAPRKIEKSLRPFILTSTKQTHLIINVI